MVKQYASWKKKWLLAAAVCVVGMAWVGQGARAQTGSAPFVYPDDLPGDFLSISTPGWETFDEINVLAPLFIDVEKEVSAHIGGRMTGPPRSSDGLTKLGGGVLRFTGPLTYRGTTRLLQGGLHIDGPGVFSNFIGGLEAVPGTHLEYAPGVNIARPLTLHKSLAEMADYPVVAPWPGLNDEVGWRVDAGYAEHSGLVQGAASFAKLGAGTLDITWDALPYTGQARVAEGSLGIQNRFSGSVLVQHGARVFGVGDVGSLHVEAGGAVAPGRTSNGIGTLHVMGDARFDPGSRFEVNANDAGQADALRVGGKALLDGEVAVLAQAGIWAGQVSYPILTAQAGFDATRFASVSSDLAYLTPELSYTADTVTLSLARNETPIGEPGETPDEKEVGEIIDETIDKPVIDGPDIGEPTPQQPEVPPQKANPDLLDRMLDLDQDQAGQALQQLTGSWSASVHASIWDDSRFVREAVLRQGASDPEFWAEAFYSQMTRENVERIEGYKRDIEGLVLGAATKLSNYLHLGGFLGLQQSTLDGKTGLTRAKAESTHAGLYFSHISAITWVVGAAHTWHRLKSQRKVEAGTLHDTLGARYRGDTTQVFGELAWRYRKGITPFARLAWVNTKTDGFTESGGSAALNVQPASISGWVSTAGLRAEATVADPKLGADAVKLFMQAAYHHASYSLVASKQSFRESLTQTPFTSQGIAPTRNAWSFQVGIDGKISKRASVGFAYLGHFGRGMQDHGIGGWARISF